jgi:ribosomal protein S18 acetylase RimI-like enzyme
MDVTIRQLNEADVQAFRAIRLDGLKRHPDSFLALYKEEAAEPDSFFAGRLRDSTVMGAIGRDFGAGRLLGIGAYYIERGGQRPFAMIWGMYVRPEARGTGISARLIDALEAAARREVDLLMLAVEPDNDRAKQIYARAGFGFWRFEDYEDRDGAPFREELWTKELG